jgi:3-oxoacyl-[acyl-carrier protein] reductase
MLHPADALLALSHSRAAAHHGVTVHAVTTGFSGTKMTAAVSFFICGARRAGRATRGMNSQSQGGLPVEVAETTAWFASPASSAVNDQAVRVCGQSTLGA